MQTRKSCNTGQVTVFGLSKCCKGCKKCGQSCQTTMQICTLVAKCWQNCHANPLPCKLCARLQCLLPSCQFLCLQQGSLAQYTLAKTTGTKSCTTHQQNSLQGFYITAQESFANLWSAMPPQVESLSSNTLSRIALLWHLQK